jgi:hypothetical protein
VIFIIRRLPMGTCNSELYYVTILEMQFIAIYDND